MLGNKKCGLIKELVTFTFVIIEVLLFPLIHFSPGGTSRIYAYAAIAAIALYALVMAFLGSGAQFIRLGIFLTLEADYFLVLKGKNLEGVVTFILVQLSYFVYLLSVEKRERIRIANIVLRVALSFLSVCIAFLVLGNNADTLATVSAIYYVNLLANMLFALLLGRRERIFAIGLALFAMCDLCIGIEVLLSYYFDVDVSAFYGLGINLPWLFYQPSQILIVLHLRQNNVY